MRNVCTCEIRSEKGALDKSPGRAGWRTTALRSDGKQGGIAAAAAAAAAAAGCHVNERRATFMPGIIQQS